MLFQIDLTIYQPDKNKIDAIIKALRKELDCTEIKKVWWGKRNWVSPDIKVRAFEVMFPHESHDLESDKLDKMKLDSAEKFIYHLIDVVTKVNEKPIKIDASTARYKRYGIVNDDLLIRVNPE